MASDGIHLTAQEHLARAEEYIHAVRDALQAQKEGNFEFTVDDTRYYDMLSRAAEIHLRLADSKEWV